MPGRLQIALSFIVATVLVKGQNEEEPYQLPTVLVVLLVRNKAHVLSHSLALIQNLDYPKSRIALYIRSDHNRDSSPEILLKWLDSVKGFYHSTDVIIDRQEQVFDDEDEHVFSSYSTKRFAHVMALKDAALDKGRHMWADFVWFIDADVFITNNQTLKVMTAQNYSLFAPLLTSTGKYSNFWGAMGEDYYYARSDDYEAILERKETGCFPVPVIHSSVLVNLKHRKTALLSFHPDNLTSNEDAPFDDMIAFALSAKEAGIRPHLCNDEDVYGYVMTPLSDGQDLAHDLKILTNLKTEIIAYSEPLPIHPDLKDHATPPPVKDKMGVDQVYLINLDRRHDRRTKMEACFEELGIEHVRLSAVDGKKDINDKYLSEMGIEMMTDFVEPYHGRPIKLGEIGCFMSHYNVWNDVIENGYDTVIVFEDDIRFEPYFKAKVLQLHAEIQSLNLDWDLIFLGRKILGDYEEPWVENSNMLVHVNYTYWTLGYMLSQRGAKILVEEQPLSKIVPVDEYLPIMYDRHPKETWKSHYSNRILKAFSVHPRFVHPTHYVGDEGYLSDTEDSTLIPSTTSDTSNRNSSEHAKKEEL